MDYQEHKVEPRQKRQALPYVKPNDKMEGVSTNKAEFPEHQITPRQNFKPENTVQKSTDPFEDKTTTRQEYREHHIEPRQRRQPQQYMKPEGAMESSTSNRRDYPLHELSPRKTFKPENSVQQSTDPFDDKTTARMDYQEYSITPRQRREREEYVPPEGKMDGLTTNRSEYPEHLVLPRQACKPANTYQQPADPFEDKTITRLDYPEHQVEPRQRRPNQQYVKPEVKMEGDTSNRRDYPIHELSPRKDYRPVNDVQKSQDPFDDKTTTRQDFPAYSIEPRVKIARQQYNKPDGLMETTTSNNRDFPAHELTPRYNFKPADSVQQSTEPFDDRTTARQDFTEHTVAPRSRRSVQQYVKPEGKMDGTTTNKSEFPEHEVTPRQNYKPANPYHQPEEPFSDKTTSRSDYLEHQIEPRQKPQPQQIVKPEGVMESNTTNRSHYPEHELTPRVMFKPDNSVKTSDGPFNDVTTFRNDFPEHHIEPRQRREVPQYVKPEDKFDCISTNKSEYPQHELTRTENYRPPNQHVKSDTPFDDHTTSRDDYAEHTLEPRKIIQHEPYKKPEGDIDFNTTNRLNYVKNAQAREAPKRPESSHLLDRNANFQGTTRYEEDFKSHEITPRPLLNKNDNYSAPTVPMETTSSTRLHFPEHELPKQEAVSPRREYVAHPVKFDGRTTNSENFKGEFAPKGKSFKPSGEPFKSDVSFDGSTTAKRDYPEHTIEPRYIAPSRPYQKPAGLMDLNTTNQRTFTPKATPREAIKRPESSHIMNKNSKFEGTSRYGDDFVEHEVKPREVKNKTPGYTLPSVGMETSTTNKLSYTEHQIERRRNYKPAAVVEELPPFDGKTGYSDAFVGHEMPVKQLKSKLEYVAPPIKFSGATTTGESYTGVTAPKQQSCRPNNEPFSSGVPLDDRTTAKQDFREHKVEPRKLIPKQAYQIPDGGFDFNTTNKLTFTPKDSPRSKINKPGSSGILKRGGTFDGSTNYGSDFRSLELKPRVLVKKSNEYIPPVVPMVGETTNRLDFTQPTLQPRQSYKPAPNVHTSNEPFVGSTGYRDTFKEHEIQRKIIKQKDDFIRAKVPFYGTTTNRQDFTGPTAPRTESFKPVTNTLKSNEPLESSTTAQRDFGKHQVERRELMKRNEYVKPTGDMYMRTTNSDNFKEPSMVGRCAAKRPPSSGVLKFDGKIDGTTNYRSDFLQHEGSERRGHRVKEAYVPNPYPFQGVTTNRSDFTQRDGTKATSFKPLAVPFSSNARFDGSTTYSGDFTKGSPPWMKPVSVG